MFNYSKKTVFFIIACLCIILLLLLILYYLIQKKKEYFDTNVSKNTSSNGLEWDSTTELVIATSHFSEDLNWLKDVSFPVVVCSKVGAAEPSIPADPKCILPNIGREASSYLKFIITYYDELPEYVAFIHGHQTAWHQTVDILQAIKCSKYKEYGFVGLNGYFVMRNINTEFYKMLINIWNKHFKHETNVEYPTYRGVFSDSCAQFIVSRENIKRHSKQTYTDWLNLILNEELPSIPSWKGTHLDFGVNDSSWKWGLIFEFGWHIIFGQPVAMTVSEYENYMKTHFTCFPDEKRSYLPCDL